MVALGLASIVKKMPFMGHVFCATPLFLSCIEALYGITSFVVNANPLPTNYIEQDATGGVMNGEYLSPEVSLSELLSSTPSAQGSKGVSIISYSKRGTSIHMDVESNVVDGTVEVPLLNYPHYEAYTDDGKSLPISTGANGTISVSLPKDFTGSVDISYKPPFIWSASWAISLISAVGIICFGLMKMCINGGNANVLLVKSLAEKHVEKGGKLKWRINR